MKQKNRERRLDNRRVDFNRMCQTTHVGQPKVDQRIESGGYHKPGSNKK